jgi:hypothetical protein
LNSKIICLLSIILGILTSLITGLIPYPTGSTIGIQKWGYPFYWLSIVITPEAGLTITWAFLLFDILFWILILFILISLVNLIFIKIKKKR